MGLNFNKEVKVYYFFSILLVIFLFSCNSNNNDFFVPKTPFKSGFEELGIKTNSNVEYNFELFKYEYKINLSIEKDLYNQASLLPKKIKVKDGEKLSTKKFYNLFLHNKKDDVVLKYILKQINMRTSGKEFDIVQVIVSFVQSIPYDEAKEQKYPIETLYLKKGDCSDKSILLAKLLDLAGFNTCLFVFEKAKHMAVGIEIDDPSAAYRSGYIYIESTGYNPIGEIPNKFAGGIKIDEEPEIVVLTKGRNPISGFKKLQNMYKSVEKKYGEGYFITTKNGKIILENIAILKGELKTINISILKKNKEKLNLEKLLVNNNCTGILEKEKYNFCLALQDSLNNKTTDYNNLVHLFNKKNDIRNTKIKLINDINKNNYIKN